LKPLTPASLSRAAFRDGSLDLSMAVYGLAYWAFGLACLRKGFAALSMAFLVFAIVRHLVFLPRAGHVRLQAWRLVVPLMVVACALIAVSAVSTVFHGGPVPPGSAWDRMPSELMLGCAVLAFLTAWVTLGLRRMAAYGGCALGLLLAHIKGLPATWALLTLALLPLMMGLGLLRRFLKEPLHVEA